VKRKKYLLFPLFVLVLAGLACNTSQPATSPATPHPLVVTLPVAEQAPGTIPLSEAGVPRISVEDAKAAVDSGQAIIVDVRSADAYAAGHVEGSINIPLGYFETDIANVSLEKDQWIITYCT
jgi:3-mercaptopyruvate sulfurtransferase SseA